MKKQKKQVVQPISVSRYIPVYEDGQIKYWGVEVQYAGNISLNSEAREKYREMLHNNPKCFSDCMRGDVLRPVIRTDIVIPNIKHLSGLFRYDREKDVSTIGYFWRDDSFGFGAERAWRFRLKMLSKIKEQKIRNYKARLAKEMIESTFYNENIK